MLTTGDFGDFFAEVNNGMRPYPWQQRLLDQVAASGRWPDRIVAPTGAGKSSVVEVHLFACALAATGLGARVPRRLAIVVNRRALVDRHGQRAVVIGESIGTASAGSISSTVAATLAGLRMASNSSDAPFDVINLRGAVALQRDWVNDPSAVQVICATPDMWGSRVLFRGYGASRLTAPRAAGLLTHDSVIVLDEAHLNQQLLMTARRISELTAPKAELLEVPALQVVETTATPGGEAGTYTECGVVSSDLDHSDALRHRLSTPKQIVQVESENWPPARTGSARAAYLDEIVDQVVRLHNTYGHGSPGGRTVGCFVNTVSVAGDVAQSLHRAGLRVEAVVGRLRPFDLKRMPTDLLTPQGNSSVDVLVATQTLEVGVDLDLAAGVSELAPAQPLAQRAGRVNRTGTSDYTEFVVIGPTTDSELFAEFATDASDRRSIPIYPYAQKGDTAEYDHLADTWQWLSRRAADPNGLAPWALTDDPPAPGSLARTLLQRLESPDAWLLSRTDGNLVTDPDLALWLRDSLESDTASAGLVVRTLPADELAAKALMDATPPLADEIYPCSLDDLRYLIPRLLDDDSRKQTEAPRRAFVFREGEISAAVVADGDAAATTRAVNESVQPGDVVVIDSDHKVCTGKVVVKAPTELGVDVYDSLDHARLRFFTDLNPNSATWISQMLDDLSDLVRDNPEPSESDLVALAAKYIDDDPRLAQLVEADLSMVQFSWGGLEDMSGAWLTIAVGQAQTLTDQIQQVHSRNIVHLDAHNQDVGDRAAIIGTAIGLSETLIPTLRNAGRWHDAGKADRRFQVFRLGNSDPAVLLAKGRGSTRRAQRADGTGGLPVGWRHEQLSATLAANALGIVDEASALTVRLVGTSHGHGRPGFPHSAQELVDTQSPEARATTAELFDRGSWDELIESTHEQWGTWGCAYLEALLRAADCQISQEGR
ncbi:type I-U CRISPR-associated helicase/endonuclease Cas3 [Nocardia sp. NPDC058705]|uniref:type I-G CRISPR-associated helicase/endonuclease Cas3g n=1 Tax=Nocardia sp. NPDC058705 TaxID=3346609 RepID=UPI0036C2B893